MPRAQAGLDDMTLEKEAGDVKSTAQLAEIVDLRATITTNLAEIERLIEKHAAAVVRCTPASATLFAGTPSAAACTPRLQHSPLAHPPLQQSQTANTPPPSQQQRASSPHNIIFFFLDDIVYNIYAGVPFTPASWGRRAIKILRRRPI